MDKESRLAEILDQPRMFNISVETMQSGRELYRMIQKYWKPNFVMAEVGSYSGGSTEIFALNCAKLFSVDPYDLTDNPMQEGNTLNLALANLRKAEKLFIERMKPYPHVQKIRKLSVDAAQEFENESLDAVYIDGNHKYDSVVNDIRAWEPKVKNGGIIAGHDYYENIALAVSNTIGVPFEVFGDSSFVFVKGRENPRKFMIKTVPDNVGYYGLMALYGHVLSSISSMKNDDTEIIVDYRGKTLYHDPSQQSPNMWDYYFEQPSRYSLWNVLRAIETGQVKNYKISSFSNVGHEFGFYNGTQDWPKDRVDRSRAAAKHVRYKPHISKIVDNFYLQNMNRLKVIGIQRRGTDLFSVGHARGQSLAIFDHFNALDAKIDQYDRVLLVTDEKRTLEQFRTRYGTKLLHYDPAILSDGQTPIHLMEGNNYKHGEDVLVETILLSRCDFLLAMSSNISMAARAMNPNLPYEYSDKKIRYE